jgi:hypothetical protein
MKKDKSIKKMKEIIGNIKKEKSNNNLNSENKEIKIKEDKKYNELLNDLKEEKNKNKILCE